MWKIELEGNFATIFDCLLEAKTVGKYDKTFATDSKFVEQIEVEPIDARRQDPANRANFK